MLSVLFCRGLRGELMYKDSRFRAHATKFMEVLARMCDMLPNLDPDAPISRKLMVLGAQHATLAGFDVTYFSIFLKSLHLTWERILHEEYTADVRDVWNTMFEFGIERLRDGYIIFHEEHTQGQCLSRNGGVFKVDADLSCNENEITLVSADELNNVH